MTTPEPTIRVRVDPANPGQFFACCGLLELADRLWDGAEGWFETDLFLAAPTASPDELRTLWALLDKVCCAEVTQIDPEDDYSSAIFLGAPFDLRLDWWKDNRSGGQPLKVWAGSMKPVRIAEAMQAAVRNSIGKVQPDSLFDIGEVVLGSDGKKVEPFYFDSRRGSNAQSLDIGFAPDSLQMTTGAYPAVEFLCLVGLQRSRPAPTAAPRVFDYHTWTIPLRPSVLPSVVSGLLAHPGARCYRFENGFRTDQRKHKAFLPATLI
jgi:hypothetical protein